MESLSRVQLYQNMTNGSFPEPLLFALRANLDILNGVEEFFLTTDFENTIKNFGYSDLLSQIRNNIQQIEENIGNIENPSWRKAIRVLKDKLSRVLLEYEKKDGTNRKTERNLFNQIINELGNFNDKIIERKIFIEEQNPKEDRPQVFLSHAYADKAYTWALFDFFYKHDVYLYVDWMHNEEQKDGRDLKKELKAQLNASMQLLFLRTLNSELDIQGKQYIKPWCSWELGSFYNGTKPDEKYLLNLYSVDNYDNVQLHGLKLYTGISMGRLQGIEIDP